MKIEDYKNAVNRMHIKSELKIKIIDSSVEKQKEISESSNLSIANIVAICLSAFMVIFGIIGIFRKINNFKTKTIFEQSIYEAASDIEQFIYEVVSDEMSSVIIPKVTFRKWDVSKLKDILHNAFYDDYVFQYGDGDIRWEYGDCFNYSYSKSVSFFYNKNYKTIDIEDKEIIGLDKNECIALADSYLEDLDISVNEKQVYALDLSVLIKSDITSNYNGERIDIIPKIPRGEVLPEWTEAQEAYLIVYTPCVDNIPLSEEGNQISVVVGKKGLAYFEANQIYEILDIVETVKIYSAEEAIDAARKYFENDLKYNSIYRDKCKLVYKPKQLEDGIYVLEPFWEFNLDETINECGYYDIDAQIGKLDINKDL